MENASGHLNIMLVCIALEIGRGWNLIYVARRMALAALDRLKLNKKTNNSTRRLCYLLNSSSKKRPTYIHIDRLSSKRQTDPAHRANGWFEQMFQNKYIGRAR